MKEYKRSIDAVRTYLNDDTVKLNHETLDRLIDGELDKPVNEMDTDLIDLCLIALAERRKYLSENNTEK